MSDTVRTIALVVMITALIGVVVIAVATIMVARSRRTVEPHGSAPSESHPRFDPDAELDRSLGEDLDVAHVEAEVLSPESSASPPPPERVAAEPPAGESGEHTLDERPPDAPVPLLAPASAPADTVAGSAGSDSAPDVPEFQMAHPVELVVGNERVGVRAGTVTAHRFQAYADRLLDGLPARDGNRVPRS